ncbi:MAG: terminase family protein, partial [Clostridia bacterium]|nr:terminase family protein [Clostridia bacterium]
RQQYEEFIKCAQDKSRIYFIENYLSTFNADERKHVPFNLFPRQKVYLNTIVNSSNVVTVKHRQCGITTVSSGWITGQLVFASQKSPETVLCIGNKKDISEQLVEKIGNFLDQVPRWMWGDDYYSPDPESPKNTKSIYKTRNRGCIELFNGCKVHARSSGENAARGISAVSILIFDEAAFIASGPTVYAQAVAACASVRGARILMVSTPNGKDPLYWKTYDNAINKRNNFAYVEFKWFQDLRYNRNLSWHRKNEETGEEEVIYETVIGKRGEIEYNEERWRKLEKEGWKPSSPWYVNMCKSFNNDSQKIAQELDISFLGSSDTVVPVEVIEKQREENVIEITDDWNLKDILVRETWIWKDPIPGHRYILSCDPSSGSGEDATAIEIIDVDAIDENGNPFFEQVLEYNGKLNGTDIAQIVDRYGRIYNNAFVVVECIGGYGDSVVLTLQQLNYPNLYYDDDNLKNYTNDNIKSKTNVYNVDKERLPGFRSNILRLQMISNFIELLKSNEFRVRSTRVISELGTWVFKNGRPNHMDGCHDDTLTCLAMGLFIMQFYMLRKEKERVKDSVMIRSWYVNN